MKSEKWKVKSEKWKVKSEKWKVKSEKWKVKSEKWKVKSYFLGGWDFFFVLIEAMSIAISSLQSLSRLTFNRSSI